jgi:hypothetical protein
MLNSHAALYLGPLRHNHARAHRCASQGVQLGSSFFCSPLWVGAQSRGGFVGCEDVSLLPQGIRSCCNVTRDTSTRQPELAINVTS